ncbi:MAG: nitroreductase/quinone reductase family protein [Vicinamibacterales bacterium]
MKIVGKLVGGLIVLLVAVLVVLRVTGLDPKDRRPGLWVTGTVVSTPVSDWSFANEVPNIHLQTNTWYLLPHSVTINCYAKDGQLYLVSVYPAGTPRGWVDNVRRDPRVRIKMGQDLYDRTVAPVTDEAEMRAVLAFREQKNPNLKAPQDLATARVFRVVG